MTRITSNSVRPELVEGLAVRTQGFDGLDPNGVGVRIDGPRVPTRIGRHSRVGA